MKKKLLAVLTLFFLSIAFLKAYEVLEDIGDSYPIGDEDMLSQMEAEYNKIDKQKLREKLIAQVREKLIARNNLPMCMENTKRKVLRPKGRETFVFDELDIHITKEDNLRLNIGSTNFIVLNAKNKKEIAWLLKNATKDSNILISEGHIETKKLEGFKNRFILDETLRKTAQIKCTPTILTIEAGEFYLEEVKMSEENKQR